MPYIKINKRVIINNKINELLNNVSKMKFVENEIVFDVEDGDINYIITRILLAYLCGTNMSYKTLNSVIGILECVKMELYRRVVEPYENKKIKDNGDVY